MVQQYRWSEEFGQYELLPQAQDANQLPASVAGSDGAGSQLESSGGMQTERSKMLATGT